VLVDLVDGHDELNVGRLLDELDDFSTLGHDSIVRCDDENDDIRDLGSSSSHGGEGSVSWSVEEADRSRLGGVGIGGRNGDGEGSNVLSDSSCFSFGDGGFSESIEKGCLSVIDVALQEGRKKRREKRRVRTKSSEREGFSIKFRLLTMMVTLKEDETRERVRAQAEEQVRREKEELRLTLVDEEGTSSCRQESVCKREHRSRVSKNSTSSRITRRRERRNYLRRIQIERLLDIDLRVESHVLRDDGRVFRGKDCSRQTRIKVGYQYLLFRSSSSSSLSRHESEGRRKKERKGKERRRTVHRVVVHQSVPDHHHLKSTCSLQRKT